MIINMLGLSWFHWFSLVWFGYVGFGLVWLGLVLILSYFFSCITSQVSQ